MRGNAMNMMKMPNMNNIYVFHKGREISISHHRDRNPMPDEGCKYLSEPFVDQVFTDS